ncbi:MAG TPA: copper chaperone PCu(A)C [Rhizomicrobium sp.]|nr:copper chaperone PCu(A)C [Rhizomicrobium sp.]
MRFNRFELIAAALLLATPAVAAQVQISDGWFRALPAPSPSGGYFTLENTGTSPIVLTGASSPACGTLMMHQSMNMNGMSSMEDVANVPVAVGGTVKFAPGGYHLMCMDPTPAMKPGGTVSVTLTFADKSEAKADFIVKNAQGK